MSWFEDTEDDEEERRHEMGNRESEWRWVVEMVLLRGRSRQGSSEAGKSELPDQDFRQESKSNDTRPRDLEQQREQGQVTSKDPFAPSSAW
jgi:hypothetical protein